MLADYNALAKASLGLKQGMSEVTDPIEIESACNPSCKADLAALNGLVVLIYRLHDNRLVRQPLNQQTDSPSPC